MLKALRDSLRLLHAIDGRFYIAVEDEGCYVDPIGVHPQTREVELEELDDEGKPKKQIQFVFPCSVSYMLEPLIDREKMAAERMSIKFEHVMMACPVTDDAAQMYFDTMQQFMNMLINRSVQQRQRAAEPDGEKFAEAAPKIGETIKQ